MKLSTRIKSAWSVLTGKAYASKYPKPGIKRTRNKKQERLDFRIVEDGK